MSDEFLYDVFISYSSKDKAWVRGELLKRIEQAGLKAFMDFRDFHPGAASIKECERGAMKCRKTLLVLTPNYLRSEWCEFEAEVVQTLTPANRKRKLIPLLKTPCKAPTRISRLTHIGLATINWTGLAKGFGGVFEVVRRRLWRGRRRRVFYTLGSCGGGLYCRS